jgi:hypothetical protein
MVNFIDDIILLTELHGYLKKGSAVQENLHVKNSKAN